MTEFEEIPICNELVGLIAVINPNSRQDSSPRITMAINHTKQACAPLHPDIPLVLHGGETQLLAYDIRMPEDGVVVSVHRKYKKTLDTSSIPFNPLITVIYRNSYTGEYDCVHIHEFNTNHKDYGSRYILQPIVNDLLKHNAPGMQIKKGTIFAKSPSKLDGDVYSTSVNCNIVAIGDPACIEDGYMASDAFCERAGLLEIKMVRQSWGVERYLLNAHGTLNKFKGLLDIGDVVGADGILMAFRRYDPVYDAIGMTNDALMRIDHDHDEKVHVGAGYIVYDITIESGIGETKDVVTPMPLATQSYKYIDSLSTYYAELLQVYNKLIGDKQQKNTLMSGRLTQLFTRAIADKPNDPRNRAFSGGRVRRCRKRVPLDEFVVTYHLYRPKPLGKGAKITDLDGGKGVICGIRKTSDMPFDERGNRADLAYYFKAGVARLNTGGLTGGHTGAAIRDMSAEIKDYFGGLLIDEEWNPKLQHVWERVVMFYEACSPLLYEWVSSGLTSEEKIHHLNTIIEDSIHIVLPYDSPVNNSSIMQKLDTVIPPSYGDIFYTDFLGRTKKLKNKGMVQCKKIIVLEKTKLDPMCASSVVRQAHGLPSGSNRHTKDAHPTKVHAFRNLSESEVRMLAAVWGGDTIAKYLAFSNDPEAHKRIVYSILTEDNPIKLPDLPADIDESRAVLILKDVLYAHGLEIVKKDN